MSIPSAGAPFLSTTPEDKNGLVKSYAEACGCPAHENVAVAVNCLRTTDLSIMTNESTAWEGSMTSLGGFVRNNIFETIRAGKFPKIPLTISVTRDEGTVQAIGFQPNDTETTSIIIQNAILGHGLKGDVAAQFQRQMLKAYPNDPVLGCPFESRGSYLRPLSSYLSST